MAERYVMDNSVLMRAFLPDRECSDRADKVLSLVLTGDISVIVPKNAMHEFCGAVTGALRKKGRPVGEAIEAIRKFQRLPIRYVESPELIERAVELAFAYNKSWYDMYYFAVAEQEGVPVCTADEKSAQAIPPDRPCRIVLLTQFPG